MRAIKQNDVIDVIYDSWYGLPLDEADKVVRNYVNRKLIPIEWLEKCKDRYILCCTIIDDIIEEWREENGKV